MQVNKVSEGVSNVGNAVAGTAENVGDAVANTAESVGDAIGSTTELLSDEETPELTRQRIDGTANETLDRLFAEKPGARDLYDQSAGYAVFDARQAGIAGVAAGFGRGVAVSGQSDDRTYMNMGTGSVRFSFGIGGFERRVAIIFEHYNDFLSFVDAGFDATAETGAMFGEDKAGETVRFIDGRSVFVLTKKGWQLSGSLAGTKYWADADLN